MITRHWRSRWTFLRSFVTAPPKSTSHITPMLRQYIERKKEYPDCLLLFQVGDFYELFSDDARRASHLLNLTLTRKSKSKASDGLDIMCGFPLASLHTYVEKLVRHHGEKVAICNQSALSAKQRGGLGIDGLVQRHVVRVVTPGSLTEDSMLQPTQNNYLVALSKQSSDGNVQIAYADISTGEFHALTTKPDQLESELCRLSPTEILLPANADSSESWQQLLSTLPSTCLRTFRPEQDATKMITDYLAYAHVTTQSLVSTPLGSRMLIDASAWRSLEITNSMQGNRKHSLLQAIDRTKTPGGARLLSQHISTPLIRIEEIKDRHEAVQALVDSRHTLHKLRHILQDCGDIERSLRRLAMGSGTPKDLKRISDTAVECQALVPLLRSLMPSQLESCRTALEQPEVVTLAMELQNALVTDFVKLNQKDGFIRPGYSAELDRLRSMCNEDNQIASLQTKYQQETGVNKLRIVRKKHQLGWCVEVPQEMALSASAYQLIQTTTKSLRYRTPDLDQLNFDVNHAVEQSLSYELGLFGDFTAQIVALSPQLQAMAEALSLIDVYCSHAQMALDHNLIRPNMTNEPSLHVTEGRHLVVESAHEATNRSFVPNSVHLDPSTSCWIITGPNMGGKSTFLRQAAHLVILAQMGSFVPAISAEIGVVDRLFSRVGAFDDLASDRSTFMVEMQETATILNQATSRSLILMDEVGRGTSVQDGLAIAQAVIEDLLRRRTRLLFATHFTELDSNASNPSIAFYHMQVILTQNGLVFSHRVVPGVASDSYGVEVAALAGCPRHVIDRAKDLVKANRRPKE
ncbi:hypothetical protein Ae201684_007501 [Aphanomyces euteiches]|uniref:DNA mismatch repair proteins mutS family domain-containing protein n=1 Tax=Aphanomyces euteiches TaxID=100861 RepID=A0A6G0X8Y1_9STRA|nr:hypothetical protein Ae201684_007501 [Aphanomyces euteiches]KAH9156805.1 hypothetical protein AeRB84_001301 [Aphanomyces euteiches]